MSFKNAKRAREAAEDVRRRLQEVRREAEAIKAVFGTLPGFSETGGRLPGLPTGRGLSEVPTTALPVSPAIFIPADYSELARQLREQRAGGWNEEEARHALAQLEELNTRLKEVAGEQNIFSPLIEQQIRNINAKVLSPEESERTLRGLLQNFFAGFQQDALSTNKALRDLASEFLRFLGGAGLPGSEGFRSLDVLGQPLTPGPRPALPPATEEAIRRTVTAGIGAAGVATHQDVSGLGASISASSDRVTSAVARIENVSTRAARETVDSNRRLAEEFRHFGQVQQRIENGVRRLGTTSLSAADLRNELERLVVSNRIGATT